MSAINYDLKKIRGIAFDVDGVLSSSLVPIHFSGEPMRMMNTKDGYAIQLAIKHGLNIAIITGAHTNSVYKRFHNLGVTDIYMGASIKLPYFNEWKEKRDMEDDEIVYMGDDIPDYDVMKQAGLPAAPADAASDIKAIAKYISPFKGGEGCGRDIIEQILKAQGKWLDDPIAFGW